MKIKLPFGMLYAHLSRMVCWGLSPDVIEDDMTSNKDTTTAASVVEASKNDVDAMVVEGDESGPIGPAKAVRIGETLDLTSNKAMLLHWKTLQLRITIPPETARGVRAALKPVLESTGDDPFVRVPLARPSMTEKASLLLPRTRRRTPN